MQIQKTCANNSEITSTFILMTRKTILEQPQSALSTGLLMRVCGKSGHRIYQVSFILLKLEVQSSEKDWLRLELLQHYI